MDIINIIGHIERAQTLLKVSEILFRENFYVDSVSRSYYAILHAASSALLIHDKTAKSHNALRRLFGEILIKGGEIEVEWSDVLSREQISRIEADYYPRAEISNPEAYDMLEQAQQFVNRIEKYLLSKGIELPQSNEE